jgi:NADPH-dependent F420 reductase
MHDHVPVHGASEVRVMKIGIVGSGNVGGALAKASVRAGHQVTLSAKDPSHAQAKAKETGARAAGSTAEAIKDAEIVILAVPNAEVDAVISQLAEALAGKIVIDVTNRMKRPNIGESVDGTSGAEQIQRKVPKAKVAKAFNYALASRQADPKIDGVQLDGFVAADDAEAKAKVLQLVGDIGFRPIDAGPLAMARTLEALAILNISLNMQHGWPWQAGWKLVGPTEKKP